MTAIMWLEDFHVGDRYHGSQELEITDEDIMTFAKRWDPQPGHLSQEEAAQTPFDGLAASGWHTAAVTMRLVVASGFVGIMGAEVRLTWPTPTRPGDRLHLDLEVTSVRASKSNPARGVVELDYDSVNQHGEVRQRTHVVAIVERRPA
ncbi:MAG: MaoC family dehydratase N-terminal domain-containing protein [Propionibacteriaceae bacterium]|nr:MaoC family dehydratase N-terminal domain-containing protein [Propionibacteriaceae bacterium]